MKVWLLCPLFLAAGVGYGTPAVRAEIVPDTTLPAPSQLTPEGDRLRIDGGTTAADNLFHSFDRFSIPEGTQAHFNNAPEIRNIFTRVTGDLTSQIDGGLAANGTANLFLLNPNGIVFGENASLDLGGSFYASSGDFIEFADGRQFSAVQPQASLLSVDVPVGLGLGSQPGAIVNRSTAADATGNPVGLAVDPGQTLAFVGGNLNFSGGRAIAQNGQIHLAAASDTTWNLDGSGLDGPATGAIVLNGNARVETSGSGGGEVRVRGDRLSVSQNSQILAETLGEADGRGIDIEVGQLWVFDDSLISTSTFGNGQAGQLDVRADTVTLDGNSQLQDILARLFDPDTPPVENPEQIGNGLYAMSFGGGQGGQVEIAANQLSLTNGSFISTASYEEGPSGNVNAQINGFLLLSGSQIVAETTGNGDAGIINLTADNILMNEGGGIFVSTFGGGDGGTVNLSADIIEMVGTTPDGRFNTGIGANAFPAANTQGGLLNIAARQFLVRDGAGVGTATFGAARAGTIIIRASERVEVSGLRENTSMLSNITTRSEGSGAAGDLEITTRRLVVRGGAAIVNSTSNSGAAGRTTLRASESVTIEGGALVPNEDNSLTFRPSGVQSNATLERLPSVIPGSIADVIGAAGDITVVTPEMSVRNGAQLLVSSIGEGERGGNLTLDTSRLTVENEASLVAETASEVGGNIEIRSRDIRFLNGSLVSTDATEAASGGNITIETETLVALFNSDITANAQQGLGGQVLVNAQAVFGTAVRDRITPESDITATSDLGAEFSGLAEITNPDVQLDSSLVELASDFVPVDRLVADSCLTRASAGGQFTVTGTGGLPETPFGAAVGRYTLMPVSVLPNETVTPLSETTSQTGTTSQWQLGDPIVEAASVQQTSDGRLWLGRGVTRDRPCHRVSQVSTPRSGG